MKKSHRYLIIQEGNVQIYIANSFKFEDVYTLLSTGEVRVVLFPHKINAWISATEKADKKKYTEIRIDQQPFTCLSTPALIASSDDDSNIQGLSEKQLKYISEKIQFLETNYFTYWDCLKEINEFEKTYPFFCPHIDTDAPLETILLEVVREYSELERKMETMDEKFRVAMHRFLYRWQRKI